MWVEFFDDHIEQVSLGLPYVRPIADYCLYKSVC